MPSNLKFYYSSGDEGTNTYDFNPSESIGGVITTSEVVSGTPQNIFGKISSKMLSEGLKQYRCIFIKNEGDEPTANLSMALIYPQTVTETDPGNLVPAPTDGDRYFVPTGGEGAWLNQSGKVATYSSADGGTWSFKKLLATHKFGFIVPADVTINDVTITKGLVPKVPNGQVQPPGITFEDKNQEEIGDADPVGVEIASGESLGMWIERTALTQELTKDDFNTEGDFFTPWKQEEDFPIVFSSDV